MTTKDSIRKAAILIDTLDPNSADALLDQMDAEQAARIRSAVMELRDVDPVERDRIVQQFLGGSESPPKRQDDGVELDGSLAAKFAMSGTEPPPRVVDEPTTPFRNLHEATAKTLASFLQHEHPQTIAVVVANLPASRAADVVGRFTPELQADVLNRVAELDETDPDIIQEIQREIQVLLADEVRTTQRRTAGLSTVRSILAAADTADRDGILANLAQHDKALAAQIHAPDNGLDHRPSPATSQIRSIDEMPNASKIKSTKTNDTRAAETQPREPRTNPAASPEIEVSFGDLARMDDRSLAYLLGVADPAMALLALTGAKREFVNRITRQLPHREAKQLQKKMQQSGPLRLSDVDHAQHYLAKLAATLAAEGKIQIAIPRRFAAAA